MHLIRAIFAILAVTMTPPVAVGQALPACGGCDGRVVAPADRSDLVIDGEAARAVFSREAFDIRTTLDAVLRSAGAQPTSAARAALLESMLASFKSSTLIHPPTGAKVDVTTRPAESALGQALLTKGGASELLPVALFNRFDLAPATGQHCGEHRIVYAMRRNGSGQRFFLIFEAALRNPDSDPDPDPDLGACVEVARFWKNLPADVAQRAKALHDFYYKGLARPGGGRFAPVVHAHHYGVPFGQVRGNLFAASPWQLREWRVAIGPRTARFVVDTVKDTPADAFWKDVASDLADASRRSDFKVSLFGAVTGRLMQPELSGFAMACRPTAFQRINGFDAGFPLEHDAMTSDSQNTSRPDGIVTPAIAATLTHLARSLGALVGEPLTGAHILGRASASTCGGCHELSHPVFTPGDPVEIAPGVEWPKSLGFVHVDEDGKLSPALEEHFLPRRKCVLEKALARGAAVVPPEVAAMPETGWPLDEIGSLLERIDAAAARNASLDDGAPAAAPSTESRALEADIERARTIEQQTVGAFDPVRRSHG